MAVPQGKQDCKATFLSTFRSYFGSTTFRCQAGSSSDSEIISPNSGGSRISQTRVGGGEVTNPWIWGQKPIIFAEDFMKINLDQEGLGAGDAHPF